MKGAVFKIVVQDKIMNEELLKELKDISILCVEDEDGIRDTIVNTLKYYFKSL